MKKKNLTFQVTAVLSDHSKAFICLLWFKGVYRAQNDFFLLCRDRLLRNFVIILPLWYPNLIIYLWSKLPAASLHITVIGPPVFLDFVLVEVIKPPTHFTPFPLLVQYMLVLWCTNAHPVLLRALFSQILHIGSCKQGHTEGDKVRSWEETIKSEDLFMCNRPAKPLFIG